MEATRDKTPSFMPTPALMMRGSSARTDSQRADKIPYICPFKHRKRAVSLSLSLSLSMFRPPQRRQQVATVRPVCDANELPCPAVCWSAAMASSCPLAGLAAARHTRCAAFAWSPHSFCLFCQPLNWHHELLGQPVREFKCNLTTIFPYKTCPC